MVKFKQVFQEMLSQNKKVFDDFKIIHDKYVSDPQTYQKQFNEEGEKILDIIRRYENRLCSHSQNTGYSKFTSSLADKFQQEVKNYLPKINSIGLEKS